MLNRTASQNHHANALVMGQFRTGRGFTLVELLTVAAIISLIASLLLASANRTLEMASQTSCRNNLKQVALGCLMYSNDDPGGYFSTAVHDTNDVVSFLYPRYVPSVESFLCPSTDNHIRSDKFITNPFSGQRELYDLTGYAGNPEGPGTSYELFGFMNATEDKLSSTDIKFDGQIIRVNGTKKSVSSVQNYIHQYDSFGLKGQSPGPSGIWLLADGDESPPGRQNYPDSNNNHGAEGGNIAACDGHVEWIERKDYFYLYEFSQDENRTE